MRPTHYLAITVRIFSILLFLYGIRQSSFLIELIGGGWNGFNVSWGFAITSTILPILVATYLWYFPMIVAKSILKPEIDQPIAPMDVQSILTVLILAIALYFLYYAIIDAVYWITLWQMTERSYSSEVPLYLNVENKANMVATAIELFVSISILLKARSLAYRMLRLAE